MLGSDFNNIENLPKNTQLTNDLITGLQKMGINPKVEDGWIRTDKGNLYLMGVSPESFKRFGLNQ